MSGSQDEIPPPPPPPPSSSQTPTQQTPHTVSTIKLPILKKGEYDIWAMKMEHYLAHTDYPIWEVIQNGNGPVSITTDTQGQIKVLPPRTAEEIVARERERKARTTLLMALPEDHLAKFHKMTDAKRTWMPSNHKFGGNKNESKKCRSVSTEDANKKFLRSLPSAWSQVSLIMRTKPGVDSLSFDDLYNNLRVFENDVKGSTASSSSSQNIAFVSENTSSTNDVSTAYSVSNTSGQNPQYEKTSSYTLLANQSSCPQLDHEDLEQLDEYDLEEMDLKWQVAMISMRMKFFYKKTGRKLQFDAKEPNKGIKIIGGGFARNSGNKDGAEMESKEDSTIISDHEERRCNLDQSLIKDRRYALWLATRRSESDTDLYNESNVECQPKVWSDAPIIEEYESDSEDEETVKNQFTHSQKPKVDKKELGYGLLVRACFVCGSLNHLIRDCDFHEKRMARKAELNNGWNRKSSQREIRQTWNNVQRVNKQNQFVPSAVLTRTGKIPVNTARASVLLGEKGKLLLSPQQVVIKDHKDTTGTISPNTMVDPVLEIDYPHRALKKKGIVDSGCSRHMTGNKAYLAEFQDYVQKQRRNNHKDFQHCLFACFLSQNEPKKISEALEDESWVDAMQEELLQFKIHKVWILVDLPFGKKAIGTKWVYRNKKDERGVVVRNKARLVAQVHRQEEGIDYDEVFAHVARIEATRIFLAFASYMGFIVYQMDVKSAFLYGKIDEEDEEASDVDVHLYRSMIGSLMYLTTSRPDIMFAVCACSRKSQQEVINFLAGDLIYSWQCKKQTIWATSTTEAEYVQLQSCCGQNPVYHSKTKHIAIRHHFIRDAYEKKLIQVLKIHTDDNVADLLTKAFDVSRGLIGFRESLRRVIDGTEALLLPTLFILWLDEVSTDSAKLVPLGKVCTAIETLKKNTAKALISLLTTITLSTTMAVLDSCPKHNMVAYLEKSEGNAEFHEIIDFLTRSSIHHALTVSPVVSTTFVEQFWTSAKSKIINNVRHITAKVAGKPVSISEASIRSDLLFDDANGIDSLPNQAIFDAIQLMGYEGDLTVLTFNKALFSPQWRFLFHTMNHCLSSKSTSWDQIPTNIATAVICLTSNQKYNFSKLIFDGMLRHLDAKKKFVMYPRFISIFLDKQLANVPVPLDHFPVNALTSKVFSFMVKKGKHFSGKVTPLFASMLVQPTEDEGAPSERPSEAQPTPSPAHTSEVPIEQQTDPSPRPSPSTIIPDSIPESSGGNLGGHSSSDKSLSGNEGEMTLQSVYDLCLSLCAQVSDQAKEIQHLKAHIKKLKKQAKHVIKHHIAWMQSVSFKQRLARKRSSKTQWVHKESVSKQGRKFAKGEPSVQRDPLFDEIPKDTLDHMETEDAQDVGRTRDIVGEEKGTDEIVLSTDKEKVSTDKEQMKVEEHNEGPKRDNEGTEAKNEAKDLLNMNQAKSVSREKEKGVELKDVEETDRPRPTSTRSLLTLKPLPKIDPKDKGKKKIEEEDESESESDGIPEAEKKFKQLESDEEMARKIQEEWEGEEERNRIAEEKAANEALIRNFDDIKARIEADRLLAEKLQEQEREQFTIEERAKFLHDTIAAQRRFLAQQRSEAIRNRPPTKNQLRNQMMTYLKHVGNFKHAELKIKKFEEVQALYEKIKRSDEDFISIGSAEDERLIKRMNEKGVDSSKDEMIKEESKAEVQEESKEEESKRKRKLGTRKKMKSRKRRYIQNTSEDDSEKENDELRLHLTIVPDEEKEVDYEILDRKYPIKEWKTECLGTKPQTDQAEHFEEINQNVVIRSNGQKRYFSTLMRVLSIFDREDLNVVYQLVMDRFQDEIPEGFDRVLWGDLMVMFNPDDENEFWNAHQNWNIVSWKLHGSSRVHTLVTETGLVIPMDLFRKGLTNAITINHMQKELYLLQPEFTLVIMSSATSAVTYTSVYTDSEPGRAFWGADDEEVSEGGIPRVIVLGYDGLPLQPVAPPSPDYIPGPENPQTPPVPQDEDEREPMFVQAHDPDYVPEPIYPEYIPLEDDHEFPAEEQPLYPVNSPTAESPGYVTESDPEEDPEEYEDDETEDGPVDYPMDGGDDGDDDDGDSSRDDANDEDEDEEDEEDEEEEEHLAPADSTTVIPADEPVFPPEGTEPVIPPPSTDITIGARITVRPQTSISLPPEAEIRDF
ncbi:ribonuclease H-like domain-containing protein [Tanacetum coccineum]